MLDKIIIGGLTCFVLYLLGITAVRMSIDRIVDNYKQSSEENEDTMKDESLKERMPGYKEWLEGKQQLEHDISFVENYSEEHIHTWKKGIVGNGLYILSCSDRTCGMVRGITREEFDAH